MYTYTAQTSALLNTALCLLVSREMMHAYHNVDTADRLLALQPAVPVHTALNRNPCYVSATMHLQCNYNTPRFYIKL